MSSVFQASKAMIEEDSDDDDRPDDLSSDSTEDPGKLLFLSTLNMIFV